MSKTKMNIVMLTGAGVSADSGVETFRASDGLWAKHNIEDVCTPQALDRNPKLVLDFYNERRRQLKTVEPNAGHIAAAKLEKYFNVEVITQNVDNLHERAGSSNVLHLHGELTKCRSMRDPSYICDTYGDVSIGDLCPAGGQLRPHIVFFGEQVPLLETAAKIVSTADIVIVAGTSLAVYPAAGLVRYAPDHAQVYVLDPAAVELGGMNVTYMREKFALAMPKLTEILIEKYSSN